MARPVPKSSEPDIVQQFVAAKKQLADERLSVKVQAERLNACIEQFEALVARMPGRVETELKLPDPIPENDDPRDFEFRLRVKREGKVWPVTYGFWEVGSDDPISWMALRDASMEIKLAVIPELPKLVIEMAAAQQRLKAKIDDVATAFEEFAHNAEIFEVGGE